MNDSLEALRQLLSGAAAQEHQEVAGRSRNRSPVRAFTRGKVTSMERWSQPNQFEPENPRDGIRFTISGAQDVKCVPGQIITGDFDLFIPLPRTVNADSEMGQTAIALQAVGVGNLLDIRNATVDAEERVHGFKGRRNTQVVGADGKDIWEDVAMNVYYYCFTKVVAGKGSATPASNGAVVPSQETLVLAGGYLQVFAGANSGPLPPAKEIIASLQEVGVNFQDPNNSGLQLAIAQGKLPEFVAKYHKGAVVA